MVWFKYIDDFLKDFNSFDNNIKFTQEYRKENVAFSNSIVKLSIGRLTADLNIEDSDRHQRFTLISLIQIIPKDRLSTVKRED